MNNRMNIVIVGYSLGGYGGMETVCKKLHQLIGSDGNHQLSFVFFNEQGIVDSRWHAELATTTLLSKIKNTKARRLMFAWQLARQLRRDPPDVVICLDTLSCYIGTVARRLCFGHFPVVSWLHFSVFDLYKYRYILRADAHLVISNGIQQQVAGLGVDRAAITTVYNPVTPTIDLIPVTKNGTNFVFIGRVIFEGQKRVRDLLDALVPLQGEWTLHVVGNGEDFTRCQEYAQESGIGERVVWHGWQAQPWQYVHEQIGSLTALVLTSAFEGLPMTLLEAMARGVYCVSADCPTGPADIIDGRNGQLYQPNHLKDLSAILQCLIDQGVPVDARTIVESIEKFYDDKYFAIMIAALQKYITRYLKLPLT